jgi:hypothetical protein
MNKQELIEKWEKTGLFVNIINKEKLGQAFEVASEVLKNDNLEDFKFSHVGIFPIIYRIFTGTSEKYFNEPNEIINLINDFNSEYNRVRPDEIKCNYFDAEAAFIKAYCDNYLKYI